METNLEVTMFRLRSMTPLILMVLPVSVACSSSSPNSISGDEADVARSKLVPASFVCKEQPSDRTNVPLAVTTGAGSTIDVKESSPFEIVEKKGTLDSRRRASLGAWTIDNGLAVIEIDANMFAGKSGTAKIAVNEQDVPTQTTVYGCTVAK
jgi:hypothetical protein